MSEPTSNTEIITRKRDQIFNLSARAWIAVVVILTVCAMSVMGVVIEEPLYTLAGMVVAYYYGQNQKQAQP